MLKKMIDEMELKSDLAKALVYRQNDDQMHFVIAELAEVAHCACMVALSETEAKAETVAAVISLPDYIAALKKCCSRAAF